MFDLGADFQFKQGQIFIHDEVAVTGTSAFVYNSPVPSYITSGATWSFEQGTTFSVAPATYTDQPYTAGLATTNNFIVHADASSALYLSNCSFLTTFTGLRLRTGMVLFDNKVAIDTQAGVDLNNTTPVTAMAPTITLQGNGPNSISWSPDGMFFAITDFVSNALEICKFNGTTAVSLGTLSTGSGPITAAWSPDGRFISMVNRGVNSIPVYSFNGRFAVLVGTASNATTNPYGVAWSPDGRFLASVSQSGGLQVFRFSGVGAPVSVATATLTSSAESRVVSWSPDGRFLAVTLYGSTTVQVYRFNGRNTLTLLSSATAFVKAMGGGVVTRWPFCCYGK